MSDLVNSITHGNGLVTTAGYDLDQRLTSMRVLNGAAVVQGSAYAYWDSVNLTYVGDEVVPANSSSIAYTPTNRLSWASGAWGSGASFAYDGMGNRTCNDLVPVTCLSLCHLSFESQGAYAAQI